MTKALMGGDLLKAIPELSPLDQHNQRLVKNVRPPDWVNPEPTSRYNLVVVGAGRAGLVTAAGAAGLGARVALVERRLMGGDCLNVGCVPSKALIRAARAAAEVRRAAEFGVVMPNGGRSRASALTIPWCTYTSPELARVGLSRREAAERNIAIDTIRVPLDQVDRPRLDGDEGLLEVQLAKGTDRIVGATLVAHNAGDIITELTLAVRAGIRLRSIAETIHPYPTQAEVVKRAADAYNRTRLTPRVRGDEAAPRVASLSQQ